MMSKSNLVFSPIKRFVIKPVWSLSGPGNSPDRGSLPRSGEGPPFGGCNWIYVKSSILCRGKFKQCPRPASNVRAGLAAVAVHARRQAHLNDPDFLLNSGKAGQFILTLGNCLLFATKVWERAEILFLFFGRTYLQLKFARAVCLDSITCWRNTAHCNIESKQPPIGGCFNPRSGVVLV